MTIGGQQWGNGPMNTVWALDLETNEYIDYDALPVYIFGAAFTYYGSDVYIHGGGLTTGIFMSNSVPVVTFYKISLKQFCKNSASSCPNICSIGTFKTESGCQNCRMGTYVDKYGAQKCNDCQEGTYNPTIGANSRRECFPCKQGEYNNIVAQSVCKICPINSYCPTGSVAPTESFATVSIASNQPQIYQSSSNKVGTLSNNFLYGCLGLFLLFNIGIFYSDKMRAFIKLFDLYSEKHNIEDDIFMVKAKNRMGGYFSIGFMVGGLWLIFASLAGYILDNIVETKALIPLVAVENEVSNFYGDLSLIVSFIRYGGKCVIDGECSADIKVTPNNILYSDYSRVCELDIYNNCIITLVYSSCEVLTGGQIDFKLTEALSYASAILVNITSTSSIPNEVSSKSIGLTATTNKVLRGYDPSVFYFDMIPSLFQSSVSDWPSKLTGYHIDIKSSGKKGSEYFTYELPFSADLNLQVILDKSTDCLNTIRDVNQTLLVLISALLGAVFGFKESICTAMEIVEEKVAGFVEKIKVKTEFSKRILNTKHLMHVFGSQKMKKDASFAALSSLDEFYFKNIDDNTNIKAGS